MYLSKLEIFGFKSFAQKTVVKFNEGITAIVGPNGCGKTNIVDAIRWCLGEQRSSALRSDKMENVIFNGTSARKPMGMSEVSLTIENTKGILPTEYSEVTITRRIFRSGESEYLLNKNICRLKDIVNLFMDTGIGANAYSVIELKMVESILSSKADERRLMFEEAAGVNKYKLRRRLALRKLDEVKADLTRVNDIVTEVEKKVNALERQAKKADKYNRLAAGLREMELDLAERELALFTRDKENFKIRKEENFSKKIAADSELSRLEDEIKGIKEELSLIESKLKEKTTEVNEQTEKIFTIQKHISVNQERKKSLERNLERFKQELDELKNQLDETEHLLQENSISAEEIKRKITAKTAEKNNAESRVDICRTDLENKRVELKSKSDFLLEKFKEINSKENELINVEKALVDKNTSIGKFNERIQALTGNIAKTVGFIEDLNQEKTGTEKRLADAEAFYTKKQKEKEDLEGEVNRLKEKELEEKGILNGIQDKINFLQNLIDNLEGFSKGVKALISSDGWAKGEKTLLANIGNSSPAYRLAIEASLKNNLNNILVESLDDLKNGIEYLRNNDIGKASFYLNRMEEKITKSLFRKVLDYGSKRKIKKISTEKGFLGWAKDNIITESKWELFFNKILSQTVIIDTLENAFELSGKYGGFNFVTLNGDFIDQSGVIEAGSAPKLDDTLFGRKQLLENLKSEYPEREKELNLLKKQIQGIEEKVTEIDLKELSDRGRLLVNDLANIEKQIAQFEYEKQKAVDDIEKARAEIQNLAGESNLLDNKRTGLMDFLSSRKEEETKAGADLKDMEEAFKQLDLDFNLLLDARNKANLELERFLGEKKNIENSIKRGIDSIENIKKSISKRENDIALAAEEKDTLNNVLEESGGELSELESRKAVLMKEEIEIEKNYTSVRNEIAAKENEQKKFRTEKDKLSDEIHLAEMKLNELGIKIENLLNSIDELYSIKLECKTFDDLDTFDFPSRTEEVHTLKQQIRNLGPINLLAYSEYEEEKSRFEFLSKQRNDLIDSEKDVAKTIEEINIAAQKLFSETFEKIRENFIKIFRGLFNPGDEADLRIEENEDPLEAKIEIIAKPKGKRPTSIELLSGGEKTLTAIALLFAIYLVKPSPFCILDEIDAPLDDANIDRFTKILRDFSKDTQFIVVTHNKRSMEAAETLYGVTMQEEGISKLVSVRFNEDMNIAS